MTKTHTRTIPTVDPEWTPRQRQVLDLLARGYTNGQIAERLEITLDGAKFHVREILGKLGVDSREDAAALMADALLALPVARILAGGAAAGAVVGVGVAAALVFLDGDGQAPPTRDLPTATVPTTPTTIPVEPTPVTFDESGWPTGFEGTLFVFRTTVGRGSASAMAEVRAIDLASGTVVATLGPSPLPEVTHVSGVLGNRLLHVLDQRVETTLLDGSGRKTIFSTSNGLILAGSASPDGRWLALATRDPARCDGPCDPGMAESEAIEFIDVATGTVAAVTPLVDPALSGFGGNFGRPRWRADGSGVIVIADTSSERPGGVAYVQTDGTARLLETEGFAYVSPDGRLVASGPGSLGCMFISGHRLMVTDVESGEVIFTIENGAMAFTPVEWASDGGALLVQQRPTPPDPQEDCSWTASEPAWALVYLAGESVPVADPAAIISEWLMGARVSLFCDGQRIAPGGRARLGVVGAACPEPGEHAVEVRVDGRPVADVANVTVLGFLERDQPGD